MKKRTCGIIASAAAFAVCAGVSIASACEFSGEGGASLPEPVCAMPSEAVGVGIPECAGVGQTAVSDAVTVPDSTVSGGAAYATYRRGIEYKSVTVYGYCGCGECRREWYTVPSDGAVTGAWGDELTEGLTVAVPASWQRGAAVEVYGGKTYIAADVCEPGMLGVYFDSHEDAVKFGEKIWFVKEVTK